MSLNTEILEEIRHFSRSRARILFGRGHAGQCKIKIKHGPLSVLTKRYVVDPKTYEAAKQIVFGNQQRNS